MTTTSWSLSWRPWIVSGQFMSPRRMTTTTTTRGIRRTISYTTMISSHTTSLVLRSQRPIVSFISSSSSSMSSIFEAKSSSSSTISSIFDAMVVAVAAAFVVGTTITSVRNDPVYCEDQQQQRRQQFHEHHPSSSPSSLPSETTTTTTKHVGGIQKQTMDGMDSNAGNDFYHGYFPKRQLFRPIYEYPIWNTNWDLREPIVTTGNEDEQKQRNRQIRKNGTTRHIILIRHGQYDETSKDDTKRTLTPLGIQQAHYTGQRIAEFIQRIQTTENHNTSSSSNNHIIQKSNPQSGDTESSLSTQTTTTTTTTTTTISNHDLKNEHPIHIIRLHVSQLTRAKQTADIISTYLPKSVHYDDNGNSDLNEGRPCHTIPGHFPVSDRVIEITDRQHPNIEHAFRTYFYRHDTGTTNIIDNPSSSLVSHHHDDNHVVNKEPSSALDVIQISVNHGQDTNNDSNCLITSENEKHEFEIIVCHANVIRYFLCR
jgi:phosphohistidine phosphatase SixA